MNLVELCLEEIRFMGLIARYKIIHEAKSYELESILHEIINLIHSICEYKVGATRVEGI